ncbi:hypothetical protein [Archangium lipolyticum]|uniref:hypothetical protein n=1 Tax=Archangium lipolyticum TaxID=2970465 RepID=UPI002149D790|nr:hypothetical protein [Archangium lipolyticum]
MSSDGKSVAFFTHASSSSDGTARTLVVKDVDTDTVVFEKVLFTEEEDFQRSDPDLERLGRVRTWEARPYMEQRQWKPLLVHQELPHYDTEFLSEACYEKQVRPNRSMSVGDLKLSYQEPRVQLWARGKKVLDRRYPSWKVRQQGCEHASPAWLQGAYVNRQQGVVLLELSFCGSHACNEPPTAFHVLRIPKEKPRKGSASPGQEVTPPSGPFVGYTKEGYVSGSLYATGFPVISEDGTRIALAEVLADGQRKDPNLLITVRKTDTNEILWKLPVLEAGELSPVRRSVPLRQELEGKVLERIRQVNEYLGGTRWVPLVEQPVQPMVTESCQQAPAQKLQLPGLELSFQQGHLVLKRGEGSAPSELSLAAPGTEACKAASRTFIDAAYADSSRGVVLLRLSTCGDEACPEQDRWYHSIKLR